MARVGEPALAHLAAVRLDRLADLRPALDVALDEPRPQVAVQPEHVLDDEHLPVAVRPGPDADGRDRHRLGDPLPQFRRHAFDYKGERTGPLDGLGVGQQSLLLALYL